MQDRRRSERNRRTRLARVPLTAAICLAFSTMAYAQQSDAQATAAEDEQTTAAPTLETVTVTAQKRTENLQEVPISIQVLSTQQLDELNVSDFEDYAKLLPSVSITPAGPGFGQVYMRGVASGGDGNHSGPLPSVGLYLDEQPITTIQGALDLHVYDLERVESLSGPQGTLYGASSEAGTIRLITNKPDPSGFEAGYGLEANSVSNGGIGYVGEGFLNVPLSDNAAIRLVGWQKKDAGYIDNKRGTRTYPTSGITADNANRAEDDYNDVDTTGARLALKVDLNDNWTITPTIMGQRQKSNGQFAFDPVVGDLALTHFYPEKGDDRWWQAALTVQGKIGNFDLVYAFSRLKRDVDTESDYNDYGFWYDTLLGYGAYFYDDNGNFINPSQYIQAEDRYKRTTHELRIASPSENRFRFVAGLFWQDQFHDIQQRYRVDGLADVLSVRGWPDTIWLTKQERRDHDDAVFGEFTFDFTDKFSGTAGFRHYRVDNSLEGYFGFSDGYSSQSSSAPENRYGQAACIVQYGTDPAAWPSFNGAPCKFFDKSVEESGTLGKVNLTYKIDDKRMIYATWSEGYRPGGLNRRGTLPPYQSDFLTNYELGWKTAWFDNRLVFNGSVFQENWKDFQFAVLGQNGLTEIRNANQARIRGLETDLTWAATYNLRLSGGFSYYDAKLTEDYCGWLKADGKPETVCPRGTLNPNGTFDDTSDDFPVLGPEAPKGTQLPVTAKFKGNLTARYAFDIGSMESYVQGSLVHEGKRTSDLRLVERDILGDLPSYETVDLSFGIEKNNWSLDFYIKNVFDERAEYSRFVQCPDRVCGNRLQGDPTPFDPPPAPAFPVPPEYANGQVYVVSGQPRTFGIKFTQKF